MWQFPEIKFFPEKVLLEEVESSFDNQLDFFRQKVGKNSFNFPERQNTFFSENILPQTACLDTKCADSITLPKKFRRKGWKVCLNLRNCWKKNILPEKKSSPYKCSFGHLECSFDNCAESNWKNGRKFFFQYPRMTKNATFLKSKIFLKMFAWTRIIQFWQPHMGNFIKILNNFHWILKMLEKTILQERIVSQKVRMAT